MHWDDYSTQKILLFHSHQRSTNGKEKQAATLSSSYSLHQHFSSFPATQPHPIKHPNHSKHSKNQVSQLTDHRKWSEGQTIPHFVHAAPVYCDVHPFDKVVNISPWVAIQERKATIEGTLPSKCPPMVGIFTCSTSLLWHSSFW